MFMVLILLGVLFFLAFLTKRRFGPLGLALAAGAMLSSLWAETLTPYVEQAGVQVDVPPLATLVAVGLVLLPAVLLLFSGPSYHKISLRVAGAICFSLLALALLLEPLGSALVLEGTNQQIYEVLSNNRVYIVTAGLVIAIVDLLSTRTSHHHTSSKHH